MVPIVQELVQAKASLSVSLTKTKEEGKSIHPSLTPCPFGRVDPILLSQITEMKKNQTAIGSDIMSLVSWYLTARDKTLASKCQKKGCLTTVKFKHVQKRCCL